MEKDIINVLVTLPVNEKHRAALENACGRASIRYVRPNELKEEDVADIEVSIGNIPHALVPHAGRIKLMHLGSAGTDGYPRLLPEGARTITLELGVRFLTDWLDGDKYFATKYPGHNLDRCRAQFALAADMEANMEKMKEIVNELSGN